MFSSDWYVHLQSSEDRRVNLGLVRFDHGGGDYEWIGTYTAYSGSTIRSELLRTRDFRRFLLEPVEGRAGRNKGMALFPEKVGGHYAMVGRQDGKNLFLLRSRRLDRWDSEGALLMEPKYPWEFIQIGNCGSPIRTDAGFHLLKLYERRGGAGAGAGTAANPAALASATRPRPIWRPPVSST